MESIDAANDNRELPPGKLEELYAAKRTILDILDKNGETAEYHLQSLDTRG